jgi:hypothetical protein
VLGEEVEDLPLVLRRLQGHGEGADEVGLAQVLLATPGVAPVGALGERDPREVEQVLDRLDRSPGEARADDAAQAGEGRVPALCPVASRLDGLEQLHEGRLEGGAPALLHAAQEPGLEAAAQVEDDERGELRPRALEGVEHGGGGVLGDVRGVRRTRRGVGGVGVAVQAPAGAAPDEPRRDRCGLRNGRAAADLAQEDLDRPPAGVGERVADGGEGRNVR